MFSSITGEQVAGLIRHLISGIGVYFIAKLNIDANTLSVVAASLATLVGIAWSIMSKQSINVKAIQGESIANIEASSLIGSFEKLPPDDNTKKVCNPIKRGPGRPRKIPVTSSHTNSRKK